MVVFPCAKINLGLNIVGRRADGYHDLETVFYPVPLCDRLEAEAAEASAGGPPLCAGSPEGWGGGSGGCLLTVDGNALDCGNDDNLVTRAYRLLAADYRLPGVRCSLRKAIPSQAGLGGGSSDAANMLRLLNSLFRLGLDSAALVSYAARLGADCAFFVEARAAFATGIGEVLEPVDEPGFLRGKWLVIVKPQVSVSTREAFSGIVPRRPAMCCKDVLAMPVSEWRHYLSNDFEPSVFARYPVLSEVKRKLYEMGAEYVQMSGSGSAVFGIFQASPAGINDSFRGCFTASMQL